MGGGVGGINYAEFADGTDLNYKFYNLRGDVILTLDNNNNVKSKSMYTAFGTHETTGAINTDSHHANTKVEDADNLLNEGKRFRHLEYAVFLTSDPLEYVDGLNSYIYVGQNPWGRWDPLGLVIRYQGSPSEVKKMKDHVEYIRKNSPEGAKVIAQLENSKLTHVVRATRAGEDPHSKPTNEALVKNGKPNSTIIYYDPHKNREFKSDETGKTFEKTPEEVLAHELTHSAEVDRGGASRIIMDKKRGQPQAETNAMYVESEISKIKGNEPRAFWHREKEFKSRESSPEERESDRIKKSDYKPDYVKEEKDENK